MNDRSTLETRSPGDVHRCFERFVNAGDLAALTSLHEPDAAFVERDGETVVGAAAIAARLGGLLAMRPTVTIDPPDVVEAGDVAVLIAQWRLTGTGPDGGPVEDAGLTYDVVRKQGDGSWRLCVDNPWGVVLPTARGTPEDPSGDPADAPGRLDAA